MSELQVKHHQVSIKGNLMRPRRSDISELQQKVVKDYQGLAKGSMVAAVKSGRRLPEFSKGEHNEAEVW